LNEGSRCREHGPADPVKGQGNNEVAADVPVYKERRENKKTGTATISGGPSWVWESISPQVVKDSVPEKSSRQLL